MTELADLLQQMRGSMNALFCESSCQARHPNGFKIVINHFQSGGGGGGACLPTPPPPYRGAAPGLWSGFSFVVVFLVLFISFTHAV